MLERHEVTRQMAVESLYSNVCPACGDRKGEQKSLCYEQFCNLPGRMKAALYNKVGQGYEEALIDALIYLKAEKFHT